MLPVDVSIQLSAGYDGIRFPAAHALDDVPASFAPSTKQQQPMRHPRAAYNTSLSQVARRGLRILKALQEFPSTELLRGNPAVSELLEHQDSFLDSIMEHLDDCHNIALALARLPTAEGKLLLKQYSSAVDPYRNHIGRVVNHIKHSQGRLRACEMRDDRMRVLGYFVEGVAQDGTVGPHTELHRGGHTAWSFARDLRLHLAGLWGVSQALADAATSALNSARECGECAAQRADDVSALVESIAALPTYVFPDEALLEPWITLRFRPRRGRSARLFKLSYPAKAEQPQYLNRGGVGAQLEGDGVTRQFRFPYLGNEFWENLANRR